jgi:sugar O-acyltransferase (sialic acid O-acetyltransferase NeuD family)
VIGSGGHAKVCMNALKLSGRKVLAAMDDDGPIAEYKSDDIELVNGVGFLPGRPARKDIFKKFKSLGYTFSTVVHPSAVISDDVNLQEGCQIMAGAVIQPGTEIGKNCIINTQASIDHDCQIGDHSHVAPGVTMCGAVVMGEGAFIGVGSNISNGLSIGKNVVIAAGKTVIKNIHDNGTLIKNRQDAGNHAEL